MKLTPNKHYRGPSKGTITWVVGHINMRVGAAMATMIPGAYMRGEDLVCVTPRGLGIGYTEDPDAIRRAVSLVHNAAEANLAQRPWD